MSTTSVAVLDQVELLKPALDAGRNSDSDAALAYVNQAVSCFDATASAQDLLAADYAQIRMLDHAVAEMKIAVEIGPALSVDTLQLGLLLIDLGLHASAIKSNSWITCHDHPLR